MYVYLVTRNQGKLQAAQSAFSKTAIELRMVTANYPEIQAETSLEIARFTSLHVAKELGAPAIREDHSLCLRGLGGAPGPYMSFFDKHLSATQLLQLLTTVSDRSGYFEVATVLAYPNGNINEYVFQVPFTVSLTERGDLQTGWNRILVLDGETRTLAEYPEQERVNIWNQNYVKIHQFFSGIR